MKYGIDKGLLVLQIKQFTKLDYEPTNKMERKVRKTSQKMESKITEKLTGTFVPQDLL